MASVHIGGGVMAEYCNGTWHFNDSPDLETWSYYTDGSFIAYVTSLSAFVQCSRIGLTGFSIFGNDTIYVTYNGADYWIYSTLYGDGWRDELCKNIIVLSCTDSDLEYILEDNATQVAPLQAKNGSNWAFPNGKFKVNGEWKQLGYGWTKVNGVWRRTI